MTAMPPHSRPSAGLRLEPSVCCICGLEDAEPIAVGEDFEYRTCPDSFLAVRCRQCGLVYLNPRPAAIEASRIYPDHYHAFNFDGASYGLAYKVRRWLEGRRLRRWCRGLPGNAKILDVGCGDGFHLQLLQQFGNPAWTLHGIDVDSRAVAAAQKTGLDVRRGRVEEAELPENSYHLILMIMTVEHLDNPLPTLKAVSRLLAPGGRLVIVTDNTGTPDFALFGGRHWGGYHFPRHTYLFNRSTIRRLGSAAGVIPEAIRTGFSPVNWVYSFRNWLDDWGGPRWLVQRLSLSSAPALALFTLLDGMLAMVGRGAILQASFRKPMSEGEETDERG